MSFYFYDKENGEETEYWCRHEAFDIQLNEDNFFANLHEIGTFDEEGNFNVQRSPDAIYDRIGLIDPTDGKAFQFWRSDTDHETFDRLERVVRLCGTYLVRRTVTPSIAALFDQGHGLTNQDEQSLEYLFDPEKNAFSDNDFDRLLEAGDGNT